MAKNEKIKKSNKAFPNRTFTDEQIKNMSSDDMILSTYQCQFVDKKKNRGPNSLFYFGGILFQSFFISFYFC